ncbi:MAG: SPOR domain-containing protein [Prevotella sp.]|nr:SPOR domain-containing protein [Prevotella sp.]
MNKVLIILISLCAALNSNAQTYLDHLQQQQQGQGTVTVTESKEIDQLVNGATSVSETPSKPTATTTPKTTTITTEKPRQVLTPEENVDPATVDTSHKVLRQGVKVTGYRIQAFYGGNTREDKIKAQQVGNNIKMRFPSQPVYVHFYNPHWTCRVGNFQSYEEAQEMLQNMKKAGFTQATLLKGKITVQQ